MKNASTFRRRSIAFAEWSADAAEWQHGKVLLAEFAESPNEAVEQYVDKSDRRLQWDTSSHRSEP